METIPREVIIEKAKEIISPLTVGENKTRKKLTGSFAIITTIVTIVAYVVLYSYKVGYCGVFNIPSECVRVDLRDYLPALVQLSGISMYVIWYVLYIKTDIAFRRAKFNLVRVSYGFLIIYLLFSMNGLLKNMPSYRVLLIVSSIAFSIEIVIYFFLKFKGFKDVKKENEKIAIENAIYDLLLYNTVIRNGVLFMLFAVIIASLTGRVLARNTTSFQTFSKDDKEFAVIVDYGEKVVVQEVQIDDDQIAILTRNYSYLSKEDITFEPRVFSSCSLVSSLDSAQNEQTIELADSIDCVEDGDMETP